MFAFDTVIYMIRDVELSTIEIMKKILISAAIRGGFGNGESYSYPWEYNEGMIGIWTASGVAIIISLVCCFIRFKKKSR